MSGDHWYISLNSQLQLNWAVPRWLCVSFPGGNGGAHNTAWKCCMPTGPGYPVQNRPATSWGGGYAQGRAIKKIMVRLVKLSSSPFGGFWDTALISNQILTSQPHVQGPLTVWSQFHFLPLFLTLLVQTLHSVETKWPKLSQLHALAHAFLSTSMPFLHPMVSIWF